MRFAPLQTFFEAPQPVVIEEEPAPTCVASFWTMVIAVKDFVVDIFLALILVCLIAYRQAYRSCWEGREIVHMPEGIATDSYEGMVQFFRELFQDPVEISSAVGLDPRINPAHFRAALTVSQEVPEAPDVDIRNLATLFDKLRINDPQSPNYRSQASLYDEEDTPSTYSALRTGLNNFVNWVIAGTMTTPSGTSLMVPNSDKMHRYLKHICHYLMQMDDQPSVQASCLIDLARAGARGCPTRMMGECQANYQRLKGEVEVLTLSDQILHLLHDTRRAILHEMSYGDVHSDEEYLASIGAPLGIRDAENAFDDNPFYMIWQAPYRAFPDFFSRLTSEKIIQVISLGINGEASIETPGARINRQIDPKLVDKWFEEHIPVDFEPANIRRAYDYKERIYDDHGCVRREFVIQLLIAHHILLN